MDFIDFDIEREKSWIQSNIDMNDITIDICFEAFDTVVDLVLITATKQALISAIKYSLIMRKLPSDLYADAAIGAAVHHGLKSD